MIIINIFDIIIEKKAHIEADIALAGGRLLLETIKNTPGTNDYRTILLSLDDYCRIYIVHKMRNDGEHDSFELRIGKGSKPNELASTNPDHVTEPEDNNVLKFADRFKKLLQRGEFAKALKQDIDNILGLNAEIKAQILTRLSQSITDKGRKKR